MAGIYQKSMGFLQAIRLNSQSIKTLFVLIHTSMIAYLIFLIILKSSIHMASTIKIMPILS